ncbi:MAG: arsenate reductase (glutaredoxin) [Hyphomicrobiaceae bacterium]
MTEITRGKDGSPVVTIYHNPKCSTSRTTLGLIREAGIEPEVIEYLKTPPGRERLVELMQAAGLAVRDLIRAKEQTYADLSLGAPGVSDKALIDAMASHPILMNRPIVVTAKGVRLCRPADRVRDILP